MRSIRTVLLTILALAATSPGTGLEAQDDPTLAAVDRLMAEGKILEARDSLAGWLDLHELSASRADQQKAIWFRALLTVDPAMAVVDLRRLILEFPGGAYTGEAILRLGLAAEARGDMEEARSSFESLVRAYPPGPLRSRAEGWIRAHGMDLPPSRAEAGSRASRESRRAAGVRDPEVGWEHSVQLGAFSSLDRALSLAAVLREAGFSPRLVRVPGPDLTRVRVGRFQTRESAEDQARVLREAGFEVTLVSDAALEAPAG